MNGNLEEIAARLQEMTPSIANATPVERLDAPPVTQLIPKELLYLDPAYQRERDTRACANLIRYLIENWDWNAYTPITVNYRSDTGLYAVTEGGNRSTAAWLIPSIRALPAMVGTATTVQDEARAFVAQNTKRVSLTGLHLFHAKVTAGDPAALRIADICARAGVTIAPGPRTQKNLQPKELLVHKTVEKMANEVGDENTVTGLRALAEAYPTEPGSLKSDLILAACRLVSEMKKDGEFKYKAFVQCLRSKTAQQHLTGGYQWASRKMMSQPQGTLAYLRQQYLKP